MSDGAPKRILVVANETVAGKPLIDAVKKRADSGPVRVHVICPQNQPKHGYVIYDEHTRDAAENRLEMTLALLKEVGVEADGEVMDPDPYAAIMDALGEDDYDEIILSTHPETRSGWLRENLVDRVARATRRPVEHVVVDLAADHEGAQRTLVVANQTVDSRDLIEALKKRASEGDHQFFVILPQSGAEDKDEEAAERLANTLKELEEAGIEAMGQVVHPDPYTAIQNAMKDYGAHDVLISTFPETRSGWLRNDLVERVRAATNRPVEHIVSEEG
jgi:hypothetical protein